jgi:hypothetical protein
VAANDRKQKWGIPVTIRFGILLIVALIAYGMHRRMPLVSSTSCDIYYENYQRNEPPNYDCAAFDHFVLSPVRAFLADVADFVHSYKDDLTAWATLAIAAFTGTLWWSTNRLYISAERQLGELRKSGELARAEFISTHRPKIIVSDIEIGREPTPDRPIVCDLSCVNVGDTEAEGIIVASIVLLMNRIPVPPHRISTPRQSDLTLDPGAVTSCAGGQGFLQGVRTRRPLTGDQFFLIPEASCR